MSQEIYSKSKIIKYGDYDDGWIYEELLQRRKEVRELQKQIQKALFILDQDDSPVSDAQDVLEESIKELVDE